MISFASLFGIGCGDNSCVWGPPGGMGTNGGCRCYEGTSQAARKERLAVSSGARLLRQIAALPDVEAALIELARKAQPLIKAIPRCMSCGDFADDHAVDDEERRECQLCECRQFEAP